MQTRKAFTPSLWEGTKLRTGELEETHQSRFADTTGPEDNEFVFSHFFRVGMRQRGWEEKEEGGEGRGGGKVEEVEEGG